MIALTVGGMKDTERQRAVTQLEDATAQLMALEDAARVVVP